MNTKEIVINLNIDREGMSDKEVQDKVYHEVSNWIIDLGTAMTGKETDKLKATFCEHIKDTQFVYINFQR